MTELFANLYFDEDVSARLADMISARGFNALTTVKAGRLGASDSEQLSFASRESRVFLTHNRRDFEILAQTYYTSGLHHAGIILAVRRPPRDLTLRLLALLNRHTADEFADQVFYI